VPVDPLIQAGLIQQYRDLFLTHGDSPEAVQWGAEGQLFRFQKLTDVAPLTNTAILDIGCGLGHLYPFLLKKYGKVKYTGMDIVPEAIKFAQQRYRDARFLCHDLTREPLAEKFDYVLMSGPFNNAFSGVESFLRELVGAGWAQCTRGLAFNFTSSHVNMRDGHMAYHDPVPVLDFCLKELSRKVVMHHHYERCDVLVYVYR
jgi:SAM-dependent methyltransferase